MMETERLHTAGDWLLRLQSEHLEQHELAEWVEWYGADVGNRAAFEEMQSSYEMLRTLPADRKRQFAARVLGPAMYERVSAVDAPVSESRNAREARAEQEARPSLWQRVLAWLPQGAFGNRERLFAAAVGAFIAFAVSFGLWYVSPANKAAVLQTTVYRTDRGKHETVSLVDGSQLRIGAKSAVFVTFTDEGRYLVLEGGEAFFKVAHDPKRPFVVQAGSISVRAVGTEFSVRRAAERVMVTVNEGVVDVVPQFNAQPSTSRAPDKPEKSKDSVRIAAGERVTLSSTDTDLAVTQTEPGAALAWQNGRLEFVDEPLRAVVATINRYSDRELILTDARLGEMSFTGTVYEGRVDEWLQALQAVFPIRVVSSGSDAILLSPVGNST
jgi:transmembrane sensor